MRRNKKGFTIVELVIVIAVIGILAAILIPTFASLTEKAGIATDQSLVKQLNTALAMKEQEIGDKKNETPTDMVEDLVYEGYYLETLLVRQKSHKKILYNLPKNRFLFEDDVNDPQFAGSKPHDFWEFKKTATFSSEGYSLYLNEDYAGGDILNLSTGLDVGKNDEEFDVTYHTDSSEEVVIRTNAGVLTLEADQGNVRHYGNADVLVINSIDFHSYHEFGASTNGQIKTGHIVIENEEASIEKLLLIAKSEEEGFDKIAITVKSGASLPELDRTKVDIGEHGTKVCDITVEDETNSIWLYSNGIYENIKITDPDATGVDETDEGAPSVDTPLGKASYEIANSALRNEDGDLVDNNGDSVNPEDAIVYEKDESPTEEELEISTGTFSGGLGTENNPYIITKVSQFGEITGEDLINKNYQIAKDFDIQATDLNEHLALVEELAGSLDGDNHRIVLPDCSNDDYISSIVNKFDGTIKNLELEITTHGVVANRSTTADISFKNVNVYGNIECVTNYGAYILVSYGATFENCNFYGFISAGGTKDNNNAIFVGYVNYNGDIGEVYYRFTNCHNHGTLISGDAALFIANNNKRDKNNWDLAYINLYISNCSNQGTINWIENTGYRPYNHFVACSVQTLKRIVINGDQYLRDVNDADDSFSGSINLIEQTLTNNKVTAHISPMMPDDNGSNYVREIADSTLKVYVNDENGFTVIAATAANVEYYVVTISTYGYYNGSTKTYTVSERFNASDMVSGKYQTTIKNLCFVDDHWLADNGEGTPGVITVNGVDYPTVTVNNEEKYYYHDGDYVLGSSLYRNKVGSVYVSAFDSANKLIASAKLSDAPTDDPINYDFESTDTDLSGGWTVDKYLTENGQGIVQVSNKTNYHPSINNDFIAFETDNEGKQVGNYYIKTTLNLTSTSQNGYNRVGIATSNTEGSFVGAHVKLKDNTNAITLMANLASNYKVYKLDLVTLFSSRVDFSLEGNHNATFYFRMSLVLNASTAQIYSK